jgi:hypothetical protein
VSIANNLAIQNPIEFDSGMGAYGQERFEGAFGRLSDENRLVVDGEGLAATDRHIAGCTSNETLTGGLRVF